MKKYLGFILVLTMIFVSGISSASAQLNIVNVKEPCTFYYPNVPWDGSKTKIMVIEPENCIYVIKYYTRVAGGREELQIVGIYQIYKENDPCPSHVDIKRLDTKYVWDNDELFGDDNSQYVVSESNCAQAYVPNPDDDIHIDFPERDMEVLFAFPLTPIITQNNYYALPVQSVIFEPCGTACCMMYYDVVRDDKEPYNVVKVNWYDPGLGSTYQEPCPSIINCTTNCESLKWNWEESLGFVKKENINQIQTERSIKVYPNPSDGEFQLELYGEFENIIKIQISDQNGIEVYNSEFSSNSSTINVDLKELSSGAYIINIIENGKNIIQENLIINK